MIVIIVICDMPTQEFSLCQHVYTHNMYMKSRKSCSETRCKIWVKFPGWPVPNPSIIRTQAKRFKGAGSVKNRKVNRWHQVLTEETLDEIGERNWTEKRSECLRAAAVWCPVKRRAGQARRERQPSVAAPNMWMTLYVRCARIVVSLKTLTCMYSFEVKTVVKVHCYHCGTSWVLTVASLQRLKMEALIPAPADCEVKCDLW